MKAALFVVLVGATFTAAASDPTPVGEGRYMLSDRALTVFGSTEKIVAKLMKQAQEFCKTQNGQEAVLLESGGDGMQPGEFNGNGQLRRAARGATGSVTFRCGSEQPPTDSKLDALAKLKALLDSGALTAEEYDAQKKKLLGE